jgi:isopenicillin-N epimerase
VKSAKLRFPSASSFRSHWRLRPGTVFLNHGSFGACPAPILEAQFELRRQMEAEPVQFLWRRLPERLNAARVVLARFVRASPRDLVFTTNATTGINAVVRSLKFRAGDELLTTSQDYNACRNVLAAAAEPARARVVVAAIPFPLSSDDEIVEAVLRAVTRRTRLVMLDHVTSGTALVLPIQRLVYELSKRGVDALVDGAHAPGMVPLDLNKLGAAYYAANLHKWVCAPKGAAFLWVREDKQQNIQPAVISHGNNRARPGYTPFQDRFDWAGTSDPTAWLCSGLAIEWMGRLLPGGWAELRRRNHELAIQARRMLCEKFQVAPPCPDTMLGAMATLSLPERLQGNSRKQRPSQVRALGNMEPLQLRLYDQFGIEVPFMRLGKPERRYLRISAQIYNSLNEYEYLAQALGRL